MPLTWDSTACTDLDTDTKDSPDLVLREAAIFLTMSTGINHITEERVKEFFQRASFVEKVSGAMRYKADDRGEAVPHFITIADVYRLVGLRTNAGTLTRAQFYKGQFEAHERWSTPYRFPTREEALDTPVAV